MMCMIDLLADGWVDGMRWLVACRRVISEGRVASLTIQRVELDIM